MTSPARFLGLLIIVAGCGSSSLGSGAGGSSGGGGSLAGRGGHTGGSIGGGNLGAGGRADGLAGGTGSGGIGGTGAQRGGNVGTAGATDGGAACPASDYQTTYAPIGCRPLPSGACQSQDDCGGAAYASVIGCRPNACGSAEGTCTRRQSMLCPVFAILNCGCHGMTYYNECEIIDSLDAVHYPGPAAAARSRLATPLTPVRMAKPAPTIRVCRARLEQLVPAYV